MKKQKSNNFNLKHLESKYLRIMAKFIQNDCYNELFNDNIIINEVKLSGDCTFLYAYFSCFKKPEKTLIQLKKSSKKIRYMLSNYVKTRRIPKIFFIMDN